MYPLGTCPPTLRLLILWSQWGYYFSPCFGFSMPLKQTAMGFEVLWCCGVLSLFA